MKKALGVLGLLIVVAGVTSAINPVFVTPYNLQTILQDTAIYAILGIGVAFVIMTGGIDLSIGSVICLVGVILPLLLVQRDWPVVVALPAVLVLAMLLGLIHGLLITKLRLQPFVVTLCGLLIYRGAARYITGDATVGLGDRYRELRTIATGKIPLPFGEEWQLPIPVLLMLALAAVAMVLLNRTIFGRYLLAVGRNEQAARFSGINTDLVIIAAYVLCATLAGGVGGVLLLLDQPSVTASTQGTFFELYAITAAVLGGCSLRGGEGSIVGVVLGAALIPVLTNASAVLGFKTTLEFAILGFVILAGAIVDEVVKRIAAARRRYREAQ
jgi:ribose transport system permease protein